MSEPSMSAESDVPAQSESSPSPGAAGRSVPTRRAVLRAGAAAGAAGTVLAAAGCATGTGGSSSEASQSGKPVGLGAASDIPVDGGKVFRDAKIVVTQPAKGSYKAFSAVCTHAGCVVDRVADGLIECPCHGSRYRVADGSVAAGPAPAPLPEIKVRVENGKLVADG